MLKTDFSGTNVCMIFQLQGIMCLMYYLLRTKAYTFNILRNKLLR